MENFKERLKNKYEDLKSDYQAYAQGIEDGISEVKTGITNNGILDKMERQGNPYYGSGKNYYNDYINVQNNRRAAKKDAIKKTLMTSALGALAGTGIGALSGNTGLGAGYGLAAGLGAGLGYNGVDYFNNLGTDETVNKLVDPMTIAEDNDMVRIPGSRKVKDQLTKTKNKIKNYISDDDPNVGMSAMHGTKYYGNGVNFSRSVNDLLALKRLARLSGRQDFSAINDLSYRLYMFY